jgi:hypothetical protein
MYEGVEEEQVEVRFYRLGNELVALQGPRVMFLVMPGVDGEPVGDHVVSNLINTVQEKWFIERGVDSQQRPIIVADRKILGLLNFIKDHDILDALVTHLIVVENGIRHLAFVTIMLHVQVEVNRDI